MDIPSVRLSSGVEMPTLGLGTWHIADDGGAERTVRTALAMGYRLIDTATLYGNEEGVGRAIRESGIPREEIFLTTKLLPTGFFESREAFGKSLTRLGLDYVDLYLVHWPIPMMPKNVWQAMEKIYEDKLAHSIGISNYGIGDIEKLLSYAKIPPAVNQIKFSPFDYAEEILKCCRSHGIVVEAYSPLTRGTHLDDEVVRGVAASHGKTPAQVMIRWCLEHDTVAIPKTTHPERMEENMSVFDWSLTSEEMQVLDALSD